MKELNMCKTLLIEAEKDLNLALNFSKIPNEKYFIEQHFDVLKEMKATLTKVDKN